MTEQPTAKPRSKRMAGFYIGMVVGLAAVVATALLLLTRRRIAQNEAGVVRFMREYVTAQREFNKNDWDADGDLEYAVPYKLLTTQLEGHAPTSLIPPIASDRPKPGLLGVPSPGYDYVDMSELHGKSIDYNRDFGLCGTPADYGKTGRRTFIVKTDGVVWGKDLGKSEFVRNFPADPKAEGWSKVED
jgi:Protein of unknown function (DUF2950)